MAQPAQLAPGLWSWSARHPDWHPGGWGAEVVSFAARSDDALILVDPLLPDDEEAAESVGALISSSGAGRLVIAITITYHVRSAEPLWDRYRRSHRVSIHGHPATAKRLGPAAAAFEPAAPGGPLPGGALPHAIGKPRRYEQPLHLPSHSAVVFGDAVVGTDAGLRVWTQRPLDAKVRAFHRERFNPTLEPLAGLGAERVLMTHGPSVLSGGSEALRAAIAAPPWYHRG